MGLRITDEAVLAMIRQLAERRGVSPGEAVRQAVESATEREAEVARRRAAIREIQAQVASLPVLDPRSPDAIIGFDETGLPA